MRLTYHTEAFSDIRDAVAFYMANSARAAENLKLAVKQSLKSIKNDPTRFSVVEDDVRRCRVQGFPFDLYFLHAKEYVKILALIHHSREPEYWKHRIDS